MGVSTVNCIRQIVESIPELLNYERRTIMKYRLLGKSGLRVSEASLGSMTFGDEWGWGSPRLKRRKSMRPTARQVETLLTRRISTRTALVKHSLESSCGAIARAS